MSDSARDRLREAVCALRRVCDTTELEAALAAQPAAPDGPGELIATIARDSNYSEDVVRRVLYSKQLVEASRASGPAPQNDAERLLCEAWTLLQKRKPLPVYRRGVDHVEVDREAYEKVFELVERLAAQRQADVGQNDAERLAGQINLYRTALATRSDVHVKIHDVIEVLDGWLAQRQTDTGKEGESEKGTS